MINVLLITGENNHDWQRSSPFCKEMLECSGAFKVDMTENPAATLADAAALAKYQLFFLDYLGADWGEPANTNFLSAVKNGTGVTVLHAADNGFEGMPEFEKMCGLLMREDAGGSHGDYHEFQVAIVDHDHPITKGMSDFLIWDELYHYLANVQNVPYRVLASAYSSPEKGGSGRHEPMAVVLQYGQGRIFHCILGHVWVTDFGEPSYKGATMMTFENKGFQHLLLRGCEWAATGKVTE